VWAAAGETLWYSHEYIQGEAVAFSESLRLRVPSTIVALASLPSGLAVWTSDATYIVVGEGPGRNGAGGSYQLELLERRGCVDSRSVLPISTGVLYQAHDTIRLLPLQGGLSVPVGSRVQDELDSRGVAVAAPTGADQHRFVASTARDPVNALAYMLLASESDDVALLVYDEGRDFWTLDTSSLFDASYGEHVHLAHWQLGFEETDPGLVFSVGGVLHGTTDDSAETDRDAVVETGEIRLAGFASYTRLRKIHVLGTTGASGTTTVELRALVEDDATRATWVSHALSITATGVTDARMQVIPKHQLCEGVAVRLTAPTPSTAIAWHGLVLEVDDKPGSPRLRSGLRG
jgi:hypothetical protein